MAVATLVPIEEYLSTSYDPEREYVDGRLWEAAEIADKVDDYLDFGVPNIWFIDSRKRRVVIHTRDGARICGDLVDTADRKTSVPLTEIFGQMPVIEE